jgi:hypothetical protein
LDGDSCFSILGDAQVAGSRIHAEQRAVARIMQAISIFRKVERALAVEVHERAGGQQFGPLPLPITVRAAA